MLIIDEKYARIILDMESVCFSEGMGPDNDELIKRILLEFPELQKEYYIIHPLEERK